jgi:DNA segregation ATPase FtsK/SpoIIIE-like protein
MGIVGAQDGARPREILVDEDEAQQILEEHLRGGM